MSDRSIGRLQKIQNTAARILTLSPRHCHISEILKRLHWLKVKFRIKYKILILTYQAYYNTAPKYVCSLIDHKSNTRSLRPSSQYLLEVPRVKLQSYGARSFRYAAPVEWNQLPIDLKVSPSLATFKSKLKTYIFEKAYL